MPARSPVPTAFYALVVARQEDQFLLIQERMGQQPWYLPAGRLDPGEPLERGALRQARQESGVALELTGVLAVQHTAWPANARVRVVFTARPAGDPTPLAFPGNASAVQAAWMTSAEAAHLPLRSPEVLPLLERAAAGQAVPLSVLESLALPAPDE